MRHYHGGLEDWQDRGQPVAAQVPIGIPENGAPAPEIAASPARPARAPGRRGARESIFGLLDRLTVGGIFRMWLWVILGFAVLYWLAAAGGAQALRSRVAAVDASWRGFGEALYFSFVTALSIGYGDVVPVGPVRALAIVEGVTGLLLFGGLISKLVSHRQEMLTEEIHRITFEDRLGRVRTSLHLVLTELLGIAA